MRLAPEIAWALATSLMATLVMPLLLVILDGDPGEFGMLTQWWGLASAGAILACVALGRLLRTRADPLFAMMVGLLLGLALVSLLVTYVNRDTFASDGVASPFVSDWFAVAGIVLLLGAPGWAVVAVAIRIDPQRWTRGRPTQAL